MMPDVTVFWNCPRALPIAITLSPTWTLLESPSFAAFSSLPFLSFIFKKAMSSGSLSFVRPMTSTSLSSVPSAKVRLTVVVPWGTTWRLVIATPSALIIKPVPALCWVNVWPKVKILLLTPWLVTFTDTTLGPTSLTIWLINWLSLSTICCWTLESLPSRLSFNWFLAPSHPPKKPKPVLLSKTAIIPKSLTLFGWLKLSNIFILPLKTPLLML